MKPTHLGAAALALFLAAPALAGPLDAQDRAKVGEIDVRVDAALDTAADIRTAADQLTDIGDHEQVEKDFVVALARAELLQDIEHMLLESCAWKCGQRPLHADPATRDEPCWTCAAPRLLVKNEHGGWLEDALAIVDESIARAGIAGLALDLPGALARLQAAQDAFAQDAPENAFTYACEAYGLLACTRSSFESAGPAPVQLVPSAAATARTR